MGGGQTRDPGDRGTQAREGRQGVDPGPRGLRDPARPERGGRSRSFDRSSAEALIGCGVKDSHAIIAADDSLLREEKMHAKEMLPPRVDAWSFLHQ